MISEVQSVEKHVQYEKRPVQQYAWLDEGERQYPKCYKRMWRRSVFARTKWHPSDYRASSFDPMPLFLSTIVEWHNRRAKVRNGIATAEINVKRMINKTITLTWIIFQGCFQGGAGFWLDYYGSDWIFWSIFWQQAVQTISSSFIITMRGDSLSSFRLHVQQPLLLWMVLIAAMLLPRSTLLVFSTFFDWSSQDIVDWKAHAKWWLMMMVSSAVEQTLMSRALRPYHVVSNRTYNCEAKILYIGRWCTYSTIIVIMAQVKNQFESPKAQITCF